MCLVWDGGFGYASAALWSLWTVWPGCILCLAQQFCLFPASMDHGIANLTQNISRSLLSPYFFGAKSWQREGVGLFVWNHVSLIQYFWVQSLHVLSAEFVWKRGRGWLRLSCDSESEAPVHFARAPRAAPWLIKSSSLNIKHHNKVKQSCCLEIVRQGPSFKEWFSTERLSPFSAPKREMSFGCPVFVKPSQCNNETMRR